MTRPMYSWKRFWCPRAGNLNLSDNGYLYDPEDQYGRILNPDVVPFESITNVPCLALLGEPGIGKTRTTQAEYEKLAAQSKSSGAQALWLDLRSYSSEDRLVRDLFEGREFRSWLEGTHQLYLFLDSLDECLLRIDTVATLLVDELQRYTNAIKRLYLRIACRTAEWPSALLEFGLRQLWGEDEVQVYELAPLRQVDVMEAARSNDVNPEAFLREVERKQVAALAIKPVTLDLLLRMYAKHNGFPSTQAELYRRGCELLCEETNSSYNIASRSRRVRKLAAAHRLAVASRIAAVTVFANRYAVWIGVDQGDVPAEDVTVDALSGGHESIAGELFNVDEEAIRETLCTGLFSSRGPGRLGWAHQTYAEFLAAHYFVQRDMPLPQRMSLLAHPADPQGKLVPQLYETAAWAAGMDRAVFRAIIDTDPDVLLRSDVATADEPDRTALTEVLLRLFDEDKLLDRDWRLRSLYWKLAHSNLASQLQPYIRDTSKGVIARGVAIDIAEACKLQILQDDLAAVALDASQPVRLRVNAAFAIAVIGDAETKAKLRPLATGEAGDDPDDELKGAGLRAIWPTHLSAEELFALLTPPKRSNFAGMYALFLSPDLVQQLQPSDLPTALAWVEQQPSRHAMSHRFTDIADSIMIRAWEHLDMPSVLERFARVVRSRVLAHEAIAEKPFNSEQSFSDLLLHDDEKRRRVLEAVLPLLPDPMLRFIPSETALVPSKDIFWMIERLGTSGSEPAKRLWSRLIGRVFDWSDAGHINAVLTACQEHSALAGEFAWLITPVRLDSDEAQCMRETHSERQRWRHRERPLLQPPPSERIVWCLEEFEAGDLSAWWRLIMQLTLEADSTHYRDDFESDLTVFPGWKFASATTRERIVAAAKRYVLEQDPQTAEWIATDMYYLSALAGYRALRLLLQEAPDFVSSLQSEVWKRWALVILAYPTSSASDDEEVQVSLVERAYSYAASEISAALMLLIDGENKQRSRIFSWLANSSGIGDTAPP